MKDELTEAKLPSGIDLIHVALHGQKIADAGNVAYWLESAGAHALHLHQQVVIAEFHALASRLGYSVVRLEAVA